MSGRIGLCTAVVLCLAAATTFGHVISVDRDSEHLLSRGFRPADLLTPGPTINVALEAMLLQDGDDIDAVSTGNDAFSSTPVLYFSVDRGSQGVFGSAFVPYVSEVYAEARAGQQAGDVYATCYGHPNPPVWSAPVGQNMLHINQQELGLYPTIFPTMPHTGGVIDDVDALSFSEFDLNADGFSDRNVYFSLDAVSPSLSAAWTADDILVFKPQGNAVAVFADGAADMGLTTGDDLDALVLLDTENHGAVDANVDVAFFSLANNSPTLLANNLSAADILFTTFDGTYSVAYGHSELGLEFGDNVDALEIQPGAVIPEPGTMLLVGTGLLAAAGIARRRRIA